jgi:hypothetical protein
MPQLMPNTSGLKRTRGPGRPKGSKNKTTLEAREMASKIVDDPVYFRNLKARAIAGRLAPAVECALLYYAKGKPQDRLDASVGVDYRWLDSRDDGADEA